MTHKGTVTLETERLILRRFTLDDAEAMFRNWASDPDVTKYMHYETCETLEQTRAIIVQWLAYIEKSGLSDVFAIILKDTHELIGTIDYAITDPDAKSTEVGYQLGKRWWHNGYAAEALKIVIKHCFEERELNRIWAMYNPLNTNSGSAMRKAGMIYEGTFRKDRVRKGVLRDSVQYAILAEDYFDRTQEKPITTNIATLKTSTDLMFYNLRIAMDTVDWNAYICGAPVWRYIYHTLHSADKFFINPSSWTLEDEPPFHLHLLDWPDTPTEIVLSKERLYSYYDKVRQKLISYIDNLTDVQLNELPGGKFTRLGLILAQFRHMYAHIGILNGITIANTQQYPTVLNEDVWTSGRLPEGLYDVEERK